MNATPIAEEAPAARATTTPSARVVSIDALRGFDMFWILGGDLFMTALGRMSQNPITQTLGGQLQHAPWAGFHFYDLVFPLFVFIVGVSLVFSLRRIIASEGIAAAHAKIFRRFILLFLLGLFYSGGFTQEWPNIRLLGVLNRIALCYLFAALVFCHFRTRGIAAICGALLIGYWALMTFVPFPDGVPGVFEPGQNLANYLDSKYLPGKKWDVAWDPEGLLSTLPAIATCLLGVLAGLLMQSREISEARKIRILLVSGLAALAAGWLWHLQFPVIKKIWTSSFVLVAGGYSALLLALFHYIIEIRHSQNWAQAFIWIGANPITLYVLDSLVGFDKLARRLAGGDIKSFLDSRIATGAGDMLIAILAVTIAILLARFLYHRKIFLRL
jgi:predicted acyltransferase